MITDCFDYFYTLKSKCRCALRKKTDKTSFQHIQNITDRHYHAPTQRKVTENDLDVLHKKEFTNFIRK